jgi:hypothetical protein
MKYANLHGYSDVYPYEVIRVISDKTIEIREMKSELDSNWKPDMVPGGFSAHCTNQDEQKYTYSLNDQAKTIRMRKRKDGRWYSAFGRHVLSENPKRFYDYNF